MKQYIALSLLAMAPLAFAANAQKSADPAQAIMVKPGQKTIQIKIGANATTGYRWFLGRYNHRFFKFMSDTYIPPKSKLIGAPGMAEFTFKVKRPFHRGPFISPIKLVYAQPWNLGTKHPVKYYVISIPGKPAKTAKPKKQPVAAHQHKNQILHAHVMGKTVNIAKPKKYDLKTAAPKKSDSTMNKTWLSLPANH